jgi:hypothetical protein
MYAIEFRKITKRALKSRGISEGARRSPTNAHLLNPDVITLKMSARMAANLASYGRPDPKRFPTRTAVAMPILCGIWKRIEENDSRIELTASATGPSKETLSETPSHAHHSEDTMMVPDARRYESSCLTQVWLAKLTGET